MKGSERECVRESEGESVKVAERVYASGNQRRDDGNNSGGQDEV
jgi:hypothetical protein